MLNCYYDKNFDSLLLKYNFKAIVRIKMDELINPKVIIRINVLNSSLVIMGRSWIGSLIVMVKLYRPIPFLEPISIKIDW